MDRRERQNRIEVSIRAAFVERGNAVFWPDQFVALNLGNQAEVLEALAGMVEADKLEARIEVRSDATGHKCWEGSPSDFQAEGGRIVCRDSDCEAELGRNSYTVIYFRLARGWAEILGAAEKKRPVNPVWPRA